MAAGATIGQALIEVLPDTDKFESETEGRMGKVFGNIAKAAAAAGIAIAAALGASVLSAASLDNEMRQVITLFGETGDVAEASLQDIQSEVRDLSNEFAIAQDELTGGLYSAISAGVPRENAFTFLETASKAAVGGAVDVETAVDGISTALNAFQIPAEEAEAVSDAFFAAVAGGKTTFDELSSSLSVAAPSAAAAGVALEEVLAATATLTAGGVPTSVAMTQIRSAIDELADPSSNVAGIFEDLAGKTFREFAAEGGTVEEALSMINDEAAASGDAIGDYFGSIQAGAAATTLATTGSEKFREEIERQADAAGFTEDAFTVMSEGVQFQMDRVRTIAGNVFTQMGQVLLPMVADALESFLPVVEKVMNNAGPFFENFGEAVGRVVRVVAPAVGEIIRVIRSVVTAVQAAFSGGGGGGAGAAIARFTNAAQDAFHRLQPVFIQFQFVMQALMDRVAPIMNGLRDLFVAVLNIISAVWERFGDRIIKVISVAMTTIMTVLGAAMDVIMGIINVVVGILTLDFARAWEGIQGIVTAVWDAVVAVVTGAFNILSTIFEGGWTAIREITGKAIEAVVAWVAGVPVRFLQALKNLAGFMRNVAREAWQRFRDATVERLAQLIVFVSRLPQRILDAIRSLANNLRTRARESWQAFRTATAERLTQLIEFVTGLPQRVLNAIKALAGMLRKRARDAWQDFRDATSERFTQLIEFVGGLPQRIVNAIKALAGMLAKKAREAWQEFRDATSTKFTELVTFVGTLPNRIVNGFGNMGSLLVNAGRDLIQGLIDGIKRMAQQAVNAATDVVKDAASSVTSFLRLSSPSRLFKGYGENTLEGFQLGLEKFVPSLPAPEIIGDLRMPNVLQGKASILGIDKGFKPIMVNGGINIEINMRPGEQPERAGRRAADAALKRLADAKVSS